MKKNDIVIVAATAICVIGMSGFLYSQEDEWPAGTIGRGKQAKESEPAVSPQAAAPVANQNPAQVRVTPDTNAAAPGAVDPNAMAAVFAQAYTQAMAGTDANMSAGQAEPNAKQPEGEWVKALEQDVNRIEQTSDTQPWQSRIDNRAELAKAVNAKITEELQFLRRLADAEGAKKTAKAIDLLIASREKRLNELLKILEDETRQERIREREERRTRTTRPDRTDRTRERTSRLREREDRTQPAPGAPGGYNPGN